MEQSRYLPEGIIHHVLRFLSATDQIRISVLSKDWLHAWQTCPALKFSDRQAAFHPFHRESKSTRDFDEGGNCRQCRLRFQDHVNRTLLNYKAEHIQEFTLDIYYLGDEESAATVDKWLEIAVKKGVKNLKLLFNRGRYRIDIFDAFKRVLSNRDRYTTDEVKYVLPGSILRDAQSLTDLALERCRFPPCNQLFNGGNFFMFNNIKSLRLVHVDIEDEVFRLLVSACPLIHNLDIQLCEGLSRIKLVNLPRLEKLNMYHLGGKNLSFEVDAPSLESLTIRYFIPRSRLLQLPASQNLRELILVRAYIKKTFFDDWTSIFPRLEVLVLDRCHGFKNINLTSHSLKHISFWLDTKKSSIKLEIDAPNIITTKFTVTPTTLEKVSFKGALPQHCVSDLCIYGCNLLSTDVSWFLKLNELLSFLNPSKILLHQDPLSEHASFGDIPTSAAHPADIQYSLREFRADLACHLAFLDGLFGAYLPEHFVLHWGVDFNYVPVKSFSYDKFVTELRNQLFSNFWHHLKKIEFHVYDNTGKECWGQGYLHWLEASEMMLHLDWSASSNLWNPKISETLKPNSSSVKNSVMIGLATEGYQLDACQCDAKMTELFNADGEDFLSS